jgi:hypothetical protein
MPSFSHDDMFQLFTEAGGWENTDVPYWLPDEEQAPSGKERDADDRFFRLGMSAEQFSLGQGWYSRIVIRTAQPERDGPTYFLVCLPFDALAFPFQTEFFTKTLEDIFCYIQRYGEALRYILTEPGGTDCMECRFWRFDHTLDAPAERPHRSECWGTCYLNSPTSPRPRTLGGDTCKEGRY